jgi:hypothetical protein
MYKEIMYSFKRGRSTSITSLQDEKNSLKLSATKLMVVRTGMASLTEVKILHFVKKVNGNYGEVTMIVRS